MNPLQQEAGKIINAALRKGGRWTPVSSQERGVVRSGFQIQKGVSCGQGLVWETRTFQTRNPDISPPKP
jgi:hypothetical protein